MKFSFALVLGLRSGLCLWVLFSLLYVGTQTKPNHTKTQIFPLAIRRPYVLRSARGARAARGSSSRIRSKEKTHAASRTQTPTHRSEFGFLEFWVLLVQSGGMLGVGCMAGWF